MTSSSPEIQLTSPQPPDAPLPSNRTESEEIGNRLKSELISVASTALILSFFLPWITILGVSVNGLTLTAYSKNYLLVWGVPLFAFTTLCLNLGCLQTGLMRRVAGLSPFIVLIAALGQEGKGLLQVLVFGTWIGLAAGALLVCIPGEPHLKKPQ